MGSFTAKYLRLDRRVLGIFRIAFGLVLLYDVLRRLPDARLLLSSEGVLSSEVLRKMPQSSPQWSLLLDVSSAQAVELTLLAFGAVFLLYALGLFTRVMQVLALICYVSLNSRNLFFEDGGTGCCVLLTIWTLLLPLGDRYSLDALRAAARLPNVASRVQARELMEQPFVSLAALALLLQAAAIYWLNAAHKSGHTWHNGDAVHLVLWQHRVNTPLGLWLAAHEPSWFSPVATWFTVRLEFLLPLLLLFPLHPTLTRPLAFVMAVLLHGGIALCLTLGPFSYAMICLVWLSVPGEALDELARRLPRSWGWKWLRLRARALRGWQALGRLVPAPALPLAASPARPELDETSPEETDQETSADETEQEEPSPAAAAPAAPPSLLTLHNAAIALMMVAEASDILGQNRAVPRFLRVPTDSFFVLYKPYVRARQAWSMFAPNSPEDDGTMVVDAVTASGRHIDPFTGKPPDWDEVRRGAVPHSIAVSDYFTNMRSKDNARYRRELKRYFKSLKYDGERLVSSEQWWVSYTSPPRGSTTPGPLNKELLWKMKL